MEQQTPATPLFVTGVPFPVTIQRIVAPLSTNIRKTDTLFTYSYWTKPTQSGQQKEKQFRTWDSPIEGVIESWDVKEGQVLQDGSRPVVHIQEPCTHDVQLHGLCALCGKDLTGTDYTGFSETSRAAISMVHDEAHRLETATTNRLLKDKKLSLIVDLDQTIVHATVDPTVGEWLEDPSNPNYKALEGVQKFQLGPDSPGKIEDGCWYYVKMRPGLRKFLQDVSEIYEMHVYTMGTRAYAIEVCKVIDPDGGLFGGRILSRDESGSLTRKSLQRLFPCDTSMVVIIDDRADVWDGSPNLVKVIPYEFFVGIGDINAAFLPKKKDIVSTAGGTAMTSGSETSNETKTDSDPSATPPRSPEIEASADPVANTGEEVFPSLSGAEASTAMTIHDQIENRPLKKAQEEAIHHTTAASSSGDTNDGGPPPSDSASSAESPEAEVPVLRDDDRELDRLWDILKEVRDTFFQQVEEGRNDADVKHIIPERKRRTFRDCKFVFSGLVPLGTRLDESEYAQLATTFGAECMSDLDQTTTHLVAKESGTAKVHTARRKHPRVPVVNVHWMIDGVQKWARQPESDFLFEEESHRSDRDNHEGADRSTTPPIDSALEDAILTAYDHDDSEDPVDEGDPEPAFELDWGDAAKEIDDFLNETDDEATDTEGGRSGGEDESDGERSTSGPRKRARMYNESDDEGGAGRTKHENGKSDIVVADSPLQKRVKVSRARKSGLKVSFPASTGSKQDEGPTNARDSHQQTTTVVGSSTTAESRRPGASRTNTATTDDTNRSASVPASPRPLSRAGSVLESSDDEAFLASMTAELESGIAQAIRLQEQLGDAVEIQVYEKASASGGVWRDALWPGASSDVQAHLYQLYSDLDPSWSSYYAKQSDILAFWRKLIIKHHLTDAFHYNSEFIGSTWSREQQNHAITLRDPRNNVEHQVIADILVSANGPLSTPQIPVLPGLETFKGEYFHNLRWNPHVDLQGKRVAVVGNGSSGVQLVPGVAEIPGIQLTHFIRSPGYFVPKINYDYPQIVRWAFKWLPGVQRLYRLHLFVDNNERWRPPLQSNGVTSKEEFLLNYLRREAPPEYLEALTPNYPFGCKRPAYDAGWLKSLHRQNVELVSSKIVAVTQDGLETADGLSRTFDVIIFATGSDVAQHGLGLNKNVIGENGLELEKFWKEIGGPQAYRGLAVPKFPNHFAVLGPNAISGSWGFSIGVRTLAIAKLVRDMYELGLTSIQPTQEAFERHNKDTQSRLAASTMNSSLCSNWWRVEGQGLVSVPSAETGFGLIKQLRGVDWKDWDAHELKYDSDIKSSSSIERVDVNERIKIRRFRKALAYSGPTLLTILLATSPLGQRPD
ncbi:CTD phosphatase Fcp1 [Microbotryomycetes sp. JL221]|nr:CTD phosphatase Fcp1 [Microbotryomycetes sp. JL221]